jgi:hypothetical protein
MRLPLANLACAVLLLLASGCTHHESVDRGTTDNSSPPTNRGKEPAVAKPADNPQGPIKPSFATRFEAASQLTSDNAQQAAFAKLAIDAANGGDVEMAKKSLGRITSDNVREDITYKFVLIFGKAGHSETALEFAKTLTSDNQRQDALAKIANGDFGK